MGGTQFIGNQATLAGGGMLLARGQAAFSRVLFQANRAGAAGAAAVLESGDGQLVLANSLLVKNVAPVGAALGGQAALLINTTLADNDGPTISAAQTVASLPVLGGPVGAQPIQLHNTIVAGGTGAPCGPADAAAPYIDLGHNLQSGGNGCGASIPVAAPQLGPSYIPLPTSPARMAATTRPARPTQSLGATFGTRYGPIAAIARSGRRNRTFSRSSRNRPDRSSA